MSLIKKIYSFLNSYRKNRYKKKVENISAKVGSDLRVNGPTIVSSNTYIGNNVNFNGMKIYGKGKVDIGDNFHSGVECMMLTDTHNYDNGKAIPYDETIISKDINIKNNVWLGNRVTVLGGVTIDEGAIIQAGSVVVNNIEKYAIAGGHPAKVFKYRDKDHYEKLKEEGKFF